MSEEDSTINPNPCVSVEERPFPVQPVVPSIRINVRPDHRRQSVSIRHGHGASSSGQETGFGQLNRRRRFQKRYKAATGPSKQRHARRFCQGVQKPRTAVSRNRRRGQSRGQTNRHYIVRRRVQVISEEAMNRHIILESQLTSLQTLRRELDSRMVAVLDALSAAAEDPTNALPRISAAAGAQVDIMKKLIDLLQTIDFNGLYD